MLSNHQCNVRAACGWRQRGMSLVELMVGIAVGLIVVAGATLLVSTQLTENRQLMAELQLQQDLRASMDIMTRELRRVGTQTESRALQTLWQPGVNAQANGHAIVADAEANGTPVTLLRFNYMPGNGQPSDFGFKLENSTIRSFIGTWQDLTDPSVLRVRSFSITPHNSTLTRLPCAKLCPGTNGTECWPEVQVREFELAITAQSVSTPAVQRTLTSRVRLRNDFVRFNSGGADLCPA